MKSCYNVERFVKPRENRGLPLIHSFLNKHVKVKVDDGLTVEGVLVCYQMENKTKHKPSILVLKNSSGFQLLRGNWLSISEMEGYAKTCT